MVTPVLFSLRSGLFKSSLRGKSVSRAGEPLPWYTYPCLHFLEFRDFSDATVLEYGGGQSTLWWAARAKQVVTIEQDKQWYAHLAKKMPSNVDLHLVGGGSNPKNPNMSEIYRILENIAEKIDVVIIDGTGNREALVAISLEKLADHGALICDDSSGYGFYEATKDLEIQRADFFGYQPGVVRPNCTSIFFRNGCFLFEPTYRIPDIAVHGFLGIDQGKNRL